jgi:opacity protein-like surface antigen
MWAFGASVGAGLPADPSLDNGLDLAANLERYLTSRVSIRGQIGRDWWDVTGRHFTGTVGPLRLDGNVVYNWEGGAIHPYVTGGIGMYRYRSTIAGAPDGSDTHAGFNLGGGLEYFFTRRATITGEALYHKVDAFNTPVATFTDGSFWSINIGMKAYFGR